jgi:hypothetical protein
VRGPKIRLRGLSEIATNPLRLILAEQLGGRSSAGFFLVIEITKFLAVAVFRNESGADCPRSTRAVESGALSLLFKIGNPKEKHPDIHPDLSIRQAPGFLLNVNTQSVDFGPNFLGWGQFLF